VAIAARGADARPMEAVEPGTQTLTVEIETGSDPIKGSVAGFGGARRPFSGWLELIAALMRARDGGAAPGPGSRVEGIRS
jgi:hypothetical protein